MSGQELVADEYSEPVQGLELKVELIKICEPGPSFVEITNVKDNEDFATTNIFTTSFFAIDKKAT